MNGTEMKYERIGKIVAVSGLNGEVMLQHFLGKKNTFKNVRAIFLEMQNNSYLPYFIESGKANTDDRTILKFDEVNSKEAAKVLLQKNAYLLPADFEKNVAEKAPVSIIGYEVIHEKKKLGNIENIIEYPQQVLLQVQMNGKEILIPLHEETLLKIDRKKKIVFVQLPDGLLEIFGSEL